VKINEIWKTSKTWLDLMNINLEKILDDLATRRERIKRWYKLSPYQFERCSLDIDSLLTETAALGSFLKDNLDQRDHDIGRIATGLMHDLEELKLLKQEMQDYNSPQDPK
jgi:hypothetical protein